MKGVEIVRKVRCPICETKTYFKDRQSLITHISKKHKSLIPEGWEASRYENFLRTGKTHGTCMVCKKDTEWNPTTNKYAKVCKDPKCKETLAKKAEENMIKKTGMTKSERMKQPDVQRNMIYSKHTSGCHETEDGHKIWYDSSYGKEFVELLDDYLNLDMSDVFGPSTNEYTYIYDGKPHMYIPDYRIQSLNLEVEIKDGGDNPNNHPKIQAVDKKKEEEKDKVMYKLQKEGKIHYIKIVNKDYREFFQLLMQLREKYDGGMASISNPQGENVVIVDEEFNIFDVPENLEKAKNVSKYFEMDKKAHGRTSSYKQIPVFYMEKIRTLKPKDVSFLEQNIHQTLATLKAKKRAGGAGGKEYELNEVIKEMEEIVIPKFNERVEYLRKKEANKHG